MVNERIALLHLFDFAFGFEVVLYQVNPVANGVHFFSINKLRLEYLLVRKMIQIAHRGNFKGVNKERENTIPYLLEAIEAGYDVEVDVWKINGQYLLGHDGPQHQVSISELLKISDKAWFHAKNFEALEGLLKFEMHVFFHDQDEYTLTSNGIIWAYSGKYVNDLAIACMPESTPGFVVPKNALGICSDNFESVV